MNISNNLSQYKKSFQKDLSGALLAAIIGLPMGLAFGVQSGLGPQAGIYTAILLPFIASLFGGTRTLISDPTGPMTVLAASVVSLGLSQAGDLANAWPLIVATFVLGGIFQILFGVLNLGQYVKYMPYPVLSGFMAGIGIIIISVQLFPLMGQSSPKGFYNIITHFADGISHVNMHSAILGLMTIAVVYLFPFITEKIPSILVALVGVTVFSVFMNWEVPAIGKIPVELPKLHLTELFSLPLSDYHYILTPAIMLAGLGVIDSLLTSVVADNITKTTHNSRWTVIGQGVGNIVTALFGGIPGAGATMGTVTNIKAGASTKLSGVLKGLILMLIMVSIAKYVAYIPNAVLAGILITIGIGIIDFKGIKMLFRVPKQDALVWAVVLFVTLFDNLLDAVGIGFALSAILFIGRMARSMENTRVSTSLQDLVDSHVLPEEFSKSIHIEKLDGPLFFGFSDQFRKHAESIDNISTVILKMASVPFLDQSGIVTLESAISDWLSKGFDVYIVGANAQVLEMLTKNKIIGNLLKDHHHNFPNLHKCVLEILERSEHNTPEKVDKSLVESVSISLN